MKSNPNIFRSNDIRGLADKDLPSEVVIQIGRAYGTYLHRNLGKKDITITVGRDVRISSPRIQEAFIKAVRQTGINVIDIWKHECKELFRKDRLTPRSVEEIVQSFEYQAPQIISKKAKKKVLTIIRS